MNESRRRRTEVDIQRTYEEIRYHTYMMSLTKDLEQKDIELGIIRKREAHLKKLRNE